MPHLSYLQIKEIDSFSEAPLSGNQLIADFSELHKLHGEFLKAIRSDIFIKGDRSIEQFLLPEGIESASKIIYFTQGKKISQSVIVTGKSTQEIICVSQPVWDHEVKQYSIG
jgi:hypothetical protein